MLDRYSGERSGIEVMQPGERFPRPAIGSRVSVDPSALQFLSEYSAVEL